MNDIVSIAKKYLYKVNQAGIPVQSAYLFGSYARGGFREFSDIDICVVSKKFGKDYFREMIQLNNLRAGIDERIEAVPLAPDDLSDKYSTLVTEIRTHGIPLM